MFKAFLDFINVKVKVDIKVTFSFGVLVTWIVLFIWMNHLNTNPVLYYQQGYQNYIELKALINNLFTALTILIFVPLVSIAYLKYKSRR